jgi:hypothetical protein
LTSWSEDDGHPDGGFYTALALKMHPERRAPAKATGPSDRTVLRSTLSTLAMKKLSGSERLRARRWAGSVSRTPEELQAKITELEALGDLTW